MTRALPFGLSIPVIYVNPALNADAGLIRAVHGCGGIGFVDRYGTAAVEFTVPTGIARGVRISLRELGNLPPDPDLRLAMIPLEEAPRVAALPPGLFSQTTVGVLVEVGSAREAEAAEQAGAAGLVARGNEGPGRISETAGFVLLQELLDCTSLPVFLQGGVGPHTAIGALGAGATGVVLDVHLLFSCDSVLAKSLNGFLRDLGSPATVVLGESQGLPCRVYGREGTRMVREMRKFEQSLSEQDAPILRNKIEAALRVPAESPDVDEGLIPLSEDIATARSLADEHNSAGGIIRSLVRGMTSDGYSWPFREKSRVCRQHGTLYPIVQGPMAHVSEGAAFLVKVLNGGALPFLALGNMAPSLAQEKIRLARTETGGTFGVGLIGLEVNRKNYEAHLEIMSRDPPPFAILAGGSVHLAQRVESMGTTCYLHCPTPTVLAEGLRSGLKHFVFEGNESGGHIGSFGSLDLWSANLLELEKAYQEGISLGDVVVLFAGGIGSGRACAFVAGMTAGLVSRGLNVGLQMGTAYLATSEVVSTQAITSTYQKLVLETEKTVIVGTTVKTRARAANSPMASTLIARELKRIQDGMPIRERKALYEADNMGALGLAAKGRAPALHAAGNGPGTWVQLQPQEQLERGLYLMGQVASIFKEPTSIEELHRGILSNGRSIFDEALSLEPSRRFRSVSSRRRTADSKILPKEITEPDRSQSPNRPAQSGCVLEPIAVVGIGLVFPGSRSVDAFWKNIIRGVSFIGDVPEGRWDDRDFYYHPDPRTPDKTYSRIGGFVRDLKFDPLTYRIPPAVALKMDRTQQMAVVCVAEALADAGISGESLRCKRTGVIIGNSMGGETTELYAVRVRLSHILSRLEESISERGLDGDAAWLSSKSFLQGCLNELPDITEDSLPGELANVISGRIANVFGLEGPNFTVDAACASSMAALAHACRELGSHSIDYAISGGVDSMMHPSSYIKFCKLGALSSQGSRPFDESADGFVMGEGAGIVVLKRLGDALRDHDRIYCTVEAWGSSSDGRGKGITAPNADGQYRALQSCYEERGINPNAVGLIEAHGTSTAVGDAAELLVLDRFFRAAGAPVASVGIGSVKSQIGHLKAAAGVAGIIKAALGIHYRTLPPTINVKNPSSAIDWATSPLFLVTRPTPWSSPPGEERRAGVSAFGFGGTNFHVLLQEHIPPVAAVPERKQKSLSVQANADACFELPDFSFGEDIWLIGAPSRDQLIRKMDGLIAQLGHGVPWTSNQDLRQEAFDHPIRCGFVARGGCELVEKLNLVREHLPDPARAPFLRSRGIHCNEEHLHGARCGVGYLFPGQGSQYPLMLRDLAAHFPVVNDTLREADEILVSLGVGPVTESMSQDPTAEQVGEGSYDTGIKDTGALQPMILAAEIAIFRLLQQMGLLPSACAGHSLGEYAACVATGVLSFRDALEVVSVRGREMSRVTMADSGLMLSISRDEQTVNEVLSQVDGYVVVANKNSLRQTVISGESDPVRKAAELFKKMGIEAVFLPVSAAFHSHVVLPAQDALKRVLQRVSVHPPRLPIFSNVTGEAYPADTSAPEKIRDLLTKQLIAPVEWVKSLQSMYDAGVRIFLECGPKRVLTGLAADTLPDDVLVVPAVHPKKGEIRQFLEAITFLAVEGVKVDAIRDSTGKEPAAAWELRLGHQTLENALPIPGIDEISKPCGLEGLMDDELETMVSHQEFGGFLEHQGEPIRALIKSSFKTYMDTFVPLAKTVRNVRCERMDFQPVVINGAALGLPSEIRFPFDGQNLDELIIGRNFIRKVPEKVLDEMLAKNIDRVVKDDARGAEFRSVKNYGDVIRLAGYFSHANLVKEYGLDPRLADSTDVTTLLAIAAGIEALKDAGIPLLRRTRVTGQGDELPEAWALPEPLRADTGVIFVSCFPGLSSAVTEVGLEQKHRHGAAETERLIDLYTGLVGRLRDAGERKAVSEWFTKEFSRMNAEGMQEDQYRFARDFVLKVMPMAHGLFAQLIKAQGPNTHINAGCAGTTQGILLARDWIRTGQARRVIVIAADDAASETLLPWVGSGFLAMGAATTESDVSRAALPFDDRRSGVVLGSAAVGLVLEKGSDVTERGMEPYASIEAGLTANSAFHGTRLDPKHISHVMDEVISLWERQTGLTRQDLAADVFFMSHETYSPKRGGSSAAEIEALRKTFGRDAHTIPITNTKGFTGHTMAVGVEDVVALRCLQRGMLPPIANLRQPDPDFADMNLSGGGPTERSHVLRLAAGFGSQIVITLYKRISRLENRITNLSRHREWLKKVTGYLNPCLMEEKRTLRVLEQQTGVPEAGKGSALSSFEPRALDGDARRDGVMSKILRLLSARTGYPEEMLAPGLDLEADLGIDTVKQAEFLSDVRDIFGFSRIEGLNIADFPTIEHIVRFVVARSADIPTCALEKEHLPSSEVTSKTAEEIRVYETRLVPVSEADLLSFPDVDRVIIAGGAGELIDETEVMLRSLGCNDVERSGDPTLPQDLAGTRLGVVNLFSTTDESSSLNRTFQLLVSCATLLDTGPSFFVTMVSQDGAFGFENPQAHGYVAGAVAGTVKAFAREFPQCRTRLLDIHPDLDPSRRARFVVESLCRQLPVEVAVGSDGKRRAVRLVPILDKVAQTPLPPEAVVLVTGGAKGITASCLNHLAKTNSLKLVIAGRTPACSEGQRYAEFSKEQWEQEKGRIIESMKHDGLTPTPAVIDGELDRRRSMAEVHITIRELQALGSEVVYREMDIRNEEGVYALVSEIKGLFGRIDVMVHAAGIEKSLPLKKKSADDMESVVSVKVGGMNNFLEAFREQGIFPGRIVGFGSVAGRFGNTAQVDYAAANDGLAHLLRWVGRSTGVPAWIIDWGPWSEVGMATRGSALKTIEAAGIDFINPDVGAGIFCRSLTDKTIASEVVVAGRLGPFFPEAFEVPGTHLERELHFAGQSANVLRQVPGEYLRAAVMLDPAHPLLDHHRIDGVAVLPGVGGMEIMSGAAGVLYPDCLHACLKEVRFTSPIKVFGNEPFEVFVEVVKARGSVDSYTETGDSGKGPLRYRARISSRFVDKKGAKGGSERLNQECMLEPDQIRTEPSLPDEYPGDSCVWLGAKDVYTVFFHGPAFRFLDWVSIHDGGKFVRFRFADTGERGRMFGEVTPALVEAVFQAAAVAGHEYSGMMALPTGVSRCSANPDLLAKGYVMAACGQIVLREERALSGVIPNRSALVYDAVANDEKGKELLTISGLEMVPVFPGKVFPGGVFEDIVPLEHVRHENDEELQLYLDKVLCHDEIAEYKAKAGVPKRAAEWLAGRVAAKRSVQRVLAQSRGTVPTENDLCISTNGQGKPTAHIARQPGSRVADVSISHSNGVAVAAAALPGNFEGLGIDVEKVEKRSENWMNDYFTQWEIRIASQGRDQTSRFTAMWALKEAALKALGTGLAFDLRDMEVVEIDDSGGAQLEPRNEVAHYFAKHFTGTLEAKWATWGNMVQARIVIR